MNATLQKSEQLITTAEQFRHVRANSLTGQLTVEDQQAYDAMLAGARAMSGGRQFNTQADADDSDHKLNGIGGGARLVDNRGRCVRGLLKNESFAGAVREMSHRRGDANERANEHQIAQFVESGELSFGGYLRSLVTGSRSEGEFAALSGGDGTAGGYACPPFLAATIIDRFRARAVMMKAGAQTIPLIGDSHSYARLTGDATATWRQENTAISESAQAFGAINMRPKSLAVYVKASRELLEDAPNIEEALERSFTESFAVELDRVGLLGMGAAAEPLGLRNDPDINEVASVGAIDYQRDILDAYKLILDDNGPDPTAYITSIREWRTYAGQLDGEGQPVQRYPAIKDLPFLATSSIPTTLGGGTESISFLGYFPDFVFGIRSSLRIDVLKELFAENHQYGFVAHLRADTAVFHPGSFCKLTGILPS